MSLSHHPTLHVDMAKNNILQESPYAKVWALLNKQKIRSKNKFKGSIYFPIGTKKPRYMYPADEDIPESELVYFKLDTVSTTNASSIMCVGMSGTFKTTLIKTLTYYNSLIPNTRIGVMDLKGVGRDWDKCNKKKPHPAMLYPQEADTLPIMAGCPAFALRGMTKDEAKKTKVMNLPSKDFADLDILTGLGFSPIAKQHLLKMLQEGVPPQRILEKVESMYAKKKISKPSYDNMSIILDNMIRADLLTDDNVVDINQIWDEKKAWAMGFNNKEVRFLSVYVDKLMRTMFDRSDTNKGRGERYWIVVDDAQKAFGSGLDPSKFPSIQTGVDALTQRRFAGVNMVVAVQSPTMLDEEIYSDIKHFFIYRCGNVQTLSKYIPNREIIDRIKTLDYRPEEYISQCIHVFPDRYRYEVFYPLFPQISH